MFFMKLVESKYVVVYYFFRLRIIEFERYTYRYKQMTVGAVAC